MTRSARLSTGTRPDGQRSQHATNLPISLRTAGGPVSLPTDAAKRPESAAKGSQGSVLQTTTSALSDESLREHLPMVRFLALRIRERLPQQVEMEDLMSAGIVGLLDAFQKFDPAKKVQFRTYAQFRVRGAILDSLRALDWGPRELRRKGRAVEEAIRTVTTRIGRTPNESEIANEMGLALEAYQELLGELSGLEIASLNATPGEDNDSETLALLPAGPEDDPFLQCQDREMRALLAEAIDELPERERLVLTLYYYEELTMREVGATLGVVESRVSQLHSSAMARLRASLHAPRGRAARA